MVRGLITVFCTVCTVSVLMGCSAVETVKQHPINLQGCSRVPGKDWSEKHLSIMGDVEKEAKEGNPRAQCELAENLRREKKYKEAHGWLEKSVEQGSGYGSYLLALQYRGGNGVPENLPKAKEYYTKAFYSGYVPAAHYMGLAYPMNERRAAVWYQKGAEFGDAGSQYRLGEAHKEGKGVPKNVVLAHKWLTLSLSDKNPYVETVFQTQYRAKAEKSLGEVENNMTSEQLDESKGLVDEWVARDVSDILAECDDTPTGLKSHVLFEALTQEAEEGSVVAQCRLGALNDMGIDRDPDMAFQWFEKAALQGHGPSEAELGSRYGRGAGVEKDQEQSLEWFLKAADDDVKRAYAGVGLHYAFGYGAPADDQEAVRWYRKGVNMGDPSSACFLGVSYVTAKGVEQNFSSGYSWYYIALREAFPNYPECEKMQEDVSALMTRNERTDAVMAARQWLEQE